VNAVTGSLPPVAPAVIAAAEDETVPTAKRRLRWPSD
jgi:hypothetical protein